jgi:hypothetical protein
VALTALNARREITQRSRNACAEKLPEREISAAKVILRILIAPALEVWIR